VRKYSNKNFKIEVEILQTNTYARLMYADIKPTNSITILAPQPGIGKTSWAKKFIQENIFKSDEKDNFVVFAKNHKLLTDEYEPELEGFGAVHWLSFANMCPDEEIVKIYNEVNHPKMVGVLCGHVCKKTDEEKKECPYHVQFQNRKLVLAPIHMMSECEDRFKYIFIDENFMNIRTVNKDYKTSKLLSNGLYKALKNNDVRYIINHRLSLNIRYGEYKDFLIKSKLWKQLSELLDFDLKEQEFLAKNKLETWYKPFLYNVFNTVDSNKNRRVIMLCATFNEEYFRDMIKFYSGEVGFTRTDKVKVGEIPAEIDPIRGRDLRDKEKRMCIKMKKQKFP
jgi:hypothetical protein